MLRLPCLALLALLALRIPDVYRNFVGGDGKRIAKLLRKHPRFFASAPLMVLRRVPADAAPDDVPPTPGNS